MSPEEKNILMRLDAARASAEASAGRGSRSRARGTGQDALSWNWWPRINPLDQIVMVMATAIARHLPGSLCSIQIEMPDGSRLSATPTRA